MLFTDYVREVPDFPKAGVQFKDITPLLADPRAFHAAIEAMSRPVSTLQATHILGIESRGFIFGAALAQRLELGFVPARKPGKLPRRTHHQKFGLEYGEDALEIHQDALRGGDRVLIVDDVLATGGTAAAARMLVESCGAMAVGLTLFIELSNLTGRDKLHGLPVFSVLRY